MAVESISSLFSTNPITTLTDDYIFEVAGDAGAGVVSGATKLGTIKAYTNTAPGFTATANPALNSTVSGDKQLLSANGTLLVRTGGSDTILVFTTDLYLNASTKRLIFQDAFILKYNSGTTQIRTFADDNFGPLQASNFIGSGSGLTSVPGAWSIGLGYLANTSGGNKAIAVDDYTAVNFSALDPTNIGLGALSTQVANLTKKFLAVYADALNLIAPNA